MSRFFLGLLFIAAQDPSRGWVEEDPDAPPQRVTLAELIGPPGKYDNKRVLVRGRLREGVAYDTERHLYELRDESVRVVRVVSPGRWEPSVIDPLSGLVGKDVDIEGYYRRESSRSALYPEDGSGETRRRLLFVLSARMVKADPPETPGDAPRLVPGTGPPLADDQTPPTVERSHPADGERGVPLDAEILVLFSNEMNPESFESNVRLVYADDAQESPSFANLRLAYDAPSRALRVSPGEKLRPLSVVRLLLYRGVVDAWGRPLVQNPTEKRNRTRRATSGAASQAVVTLTFFTRGL